MFELVARARSQIQKSEWPRRARRACVGIACAVGAALLGCSGERGSGPELSPAAHEGQHVYLSTCTACHNADPNLPGAIGPEIAGSSRELIEARVLRGEYPPGYTPKRTSRAMVPLPHLEGKIDELAAFLSEAADG
jgi:mono/diheme cytochrome c family protein